jgi:hypothetical protein
MSDQSSGTIGSERVLNGLNRSKTTMIAAMLSALSGQIQNIQNTLNNLKNGLLGKKINPKENTNGLQSPSTGNKKANTNGLQSTSTGNGLPHTAIPYVANLYNSPKFRKEKRNAIEAERLAMADGLENEGKTLTTQAFSGISQRTRNIKNNAKSLHSRKARKTRRSRK